jgi:hypothetical protein
MLMKSILLFFPLLLSTACIPEQQFPDEEEVQSSDYVTVEEERPVPPKFVTVDEQGRLVDSRNGQVLKLKDPGETVEEESLFDSDIESATNQFRLKFKKTTDSLRPVAGRPVKLRNRKAMN